MRSEDNVEAAQDPSLAEADKLQPEAGLTEPDTSGQLSDRNHYALELKLQGRSNAAIAREIGVSRQTVSGWCNDPLFKTELKRRQKEISGQIREGLESLFLRSVDTYGELLEDEDPKVRRFAAKDVSELWLKLDARDAAAAAAKEAALAAEREALGGLTMNDMLKMALLEFDRIRARPTLKQAEEQAGNEASLPETSEEGNPQAVPQPTAEMLTKVRKMQKRLPAILGDYRQELPAFKPMINALRSDPEGLALLLEATENQRGQKDQSPAPEAEEGNTGDEQDTGHEDHEEEEDSAEDRAD